jgi:hypothetical protein
MLGTYVASDLKNPYRNLEGRATELVIYLLCTFLSKLKFKRSLQTSGATASFGAYLVQMLTLACGNNLKLGETNSGSFHNACTIKAAFR